MMIERANAPAKTLWWWPMPSSGTFVLTARAKTKTPTTIDGKPFRTSSQSLICPATRGGANSLAYRATRTPTGSATAVAAATGRRRAARPQLPAARRSPSASLPDVEAVHDPLRGEVGGEGDREQDQRQVDERRYRGARAGAL